MDQFRSEKGADALTKATNAARTALPGAHFRPTIESNSSDRIGKGRDMFVQALLSEFDEEMAKTRRSLERVPNDRLDWRPHEKSMTMGRLATHLAEIPAWTIETLGHESLDISPPGQPPHVPRFLRSQPEVLDLFDRNVSTGRALLAATNEDQLTVPWSLLSGGKVLFTQPRLAVLRAWVFNHAVHHRAQLGVYLRLNDIPLPAIYGPSADEQ